ncbi:hypothetical protein OG874_21615 [Nocardia sp. NBC_00565]|uniref:hypothetical protein n=1 Tax=Nocardia sp. NBC_00565 TaxID=2975993 RepID=UPI002E7FBB43|nr:hypothetical protein [Nocardia sp. NBC_00565]WUC07524.1 hypothetical protein OG874_21615 [Nocardia sp. NBC_00565]
MNHDDVETEIRLGIECAEQIIAARSRELTAYRTPQRGLLVAEGDSWFDYPGTDILSILKDAGWEIVSVAHWGDSLEDMAYTPCQLTALASKLERIKSQNVVPVAILLSGGGNDFAGPAMAMLIEHQSSARPGLNDLIVNEMISGRLQNSWARLISATTRLCENYFDKKIPIVVHGYDYPIPDGRGFSAFKGWGILPGPWMGPSFAAKGFDVIPKRTAMMTDLIDRYNTMLTALAARPTFGHVTVVDLRGTLESGQRYRDDWENELHPTPEGFELVAAKFAEALVPLSNPE